MTIYLHVDSPPLFEVRVPVLLAILAYLSAACDNGASTGSAVGIGGHSASGGINSANYGGESSSVQPGVSSLGGMTSTGRASTTGGTSTRGGTSATGGNSGAGAATGLLGLTTVTVGAEHSCALHGDGHVVCWGNNTSGQSGNDSTEPWIAAPVRVLELSSVIQISAGEGHTCAVKSDGTVYCWGGNSVGELGDGSTTSRRVPVAVSDLSDVVNLSAGPRRTCAVKRDGSVYCWGRWEVDT